MISESQADLIDQVLGIDSSVGVQTEDWPYSDDFALQRMNLGASLTILQNVEGEIVRYTIHHVGHPYKLATEIGRWIVEQLALKECWSQQQIGSINLGGGQITLYQVEGVTSK